MDIVVEFKPGQTHKAIWNDRYTLSVFSHSFYSGKPGKPVFDKEKENRVYHLEDRHIVGFSVAVDGSEVDGSEIEMDQDSMGRLAAHFKWIDPIPCRIDIPVSRGWIEAPPAVVRAVKNQKPVNLVFIKRRKRKAKGK